MGEDVPMWPVRFMLGQALTTKAKQSLFVLSRELELAVYREPYHLGHESQRDDLLFTLEQDYNGAKVDLPPIEECAKQVVYLVIMEGVPHILPESHVLGTVYGYALGKAGIAAADRVSYLPWMVARTEASSLLRSVTPDDIPATEKVAA